MGCALGVLVRRRHGRRGVPRRRAGGARRAGRPDQPQREVRPGHPSHAGDRRAGHHRRRAGRARVVSAPRDPEELDAAAAPIGSELPDGTRLGAVHLTVSDLAGSLAYYEAGVGLQVLDRDGGRASLGADGTVLLELVEEPGARPAAGFTGLYHFALLVPQRLDLAGWLAHAARDRVPLTGLSDHFVSEALYLSDPDGHGIEIYWDRPREHWEGQVAERLTSAPLDVQDLLRELDDPATERFEGLPAGTVMGHVHLRVAAVDPTIAFYRDVLGFALMAQLGSQ